MNKLKIEDIQEGESISFEEVFYENDVDKYAELTGDLSPIHVYSDFAGKRGYPGRVIHGMLLAGLFSRVVGVYIPGENALLQSASLKFHAPVFPGDHLLVSAVVTQVSRGANVIVISSTITKKSTGEKVASSKLQVGFTTEKNLTMES